MEHMTDVPDPELHRYEGPRLPPDRAWLMIGYQRMVELARRRLPITITADGHASPQEDWRIVQAAFMARIARTAESMSALVPMGARLDAMNLARNLLEHVACMAWIAAEPDVRFEVWLKKDYMSRMAYDRTVRQRIADNVEGRWPERPLASDDVAAYERLVSRVTGKFPRAEDMFKEADEYWLSRYPAGLADHRSMSFANQHEHIYDKYSWLSHPRLTGLQAFWDFQSQWTVVHAGEVDEHDHDPLHMGQLLVGQGLLISAMATGTPNVSDVVELMNSNAGLSRLARDGRLVTTEVSPGNFQLRLMDESSA
jgi:hypothetical protein